MATEASLSSFEKSHLESRTNQAIQLVINDALGVASHSPILKPSFKDLKFLFKDTLDLQQPLQLVGDNIFSDEVFSHLRAEFPWEDIRAFTPEEVKQAAKAVGLTVYDAEHPFPYSNVHLKPDEFFVISFDENQDKVSLPQPTVLQKITSFLTGPSKPRLEGKYTLLRWLNAERLIFGLTLRKKSDTEFEVKVKDLAEYAKHGEQSSDIIAKITKQLNYLLPTIKLSQPTVFIPTEKLIPSKDHLQAVTRHGPWKKAKGIHFFDSEVPDNLK